MREPAHREVRSCFFPRRRVPVADARLSGRRDACAMPEQAAKTGDDPMAITRIESVTYGVDELADSIRFVEDFGLDRIDTSNDRVVFATPANQSLRLVAAQARDLPEGLEAGSTLRELIWGVDSIASLDALHNTLSRDRAVRVDGEGVLHTHDETGYAIGFALAQPLPIGEIRRGGDGAGRAQGVRDDLFYWNRTFDAYTRARVLRLARVTLDIPELGRDAAIDFYRHRLGFELAASAPGAGSFLRCGAGVGRHGLRLSERANRPGINRIAFEVGDLDDLIAGGNFMGAQGWQGSRRLDRDRSGANVFRCFDAPCGGRFEYAAERDPANERGGVRFREMLSRQDPVSVAMRVDGMSY
ncbi:VOC family protein [Burkholderia gladioli]|uniref:VOC family protein n=2 Tax=Burkholderia gladioli TaxID=28095 RepID=UPI001640674B|nr:VOC family protein [Burkholderia gladioli]MDD1787604.1 VOC family protein [Burkholderia gladioli]